MHPPFRLLIIGPSTGWHVLDLKRAAKAVDFEIEVVSKPFLDLADEVAEPVQQTPCDSDRGQCSSSLFGFDAAITRAMPAGSLEQIVFRMDVLGRMERRGVFMANSAKALETSVDKYLSLSCIAEVGLPVPRTRVSQGVEQALLDFESLGQDVVVKPIFGSLGNRIVRISDIQTARSVFESRVEAGEVIYQQVFVHHDHWDVRIFLFGDHVFSMKRHHPSHWITNIHQGATGSLYSPPTELIDMARQAANAVDAKLAGVDLIYDKTLAKWFVLEVNAAPGWRTLSQVLQQDVAAQMLHWLKRASVG